MRAIIPKQHVDDINEAELITGLKSGNQNAFRKHYTMNSAALLGVLMKTVAQQETVEHLLQECFLKINRSFALNDPNKGRLFTWMLNLGRNTAIDYTRLKSSRNNKETFEYEDVLDEIKDLESTSFNIDAIGLEKFVRLLSDKHQLMITLSYYQDYSHTEIAEKLDITLRSVKTCIRLALTSLKEKFAQGDELSSFRKSA